MKILPGICLFLLLAGTAQGAVFDLNYDPPLLLNGKVRGVTLKDVKLHNPEKGITVMAVLCRKKFDGSRSAQERDMILQRRGQFMLGYDGGKLLVKFGKTLTFTVPVRLDDQEYHAIGLTTERINDITQGDDYFQIKIYFDGELIFSKNAVTKNIPESKADITAGYSEELGSDWYFGGELVNICAYNRILTLAEIQRYTAKFKQIRNRAKTQLSSREQKLLDDLPEKTGRDIFLAAASAVRNLAAGNSKFDWQGAAHAILRAEKNKLGKLPPSSGLKQYKIKNAILTVAVSSRAARAVSLYDCIARREILSPDNPWFRVRYKNKTISPLSGEFICAFKDLGKEKFQLVWQSPELIIKSFFDCKNELAYTLEVVSRSEDTLQKVEFPALELRPLSGDGTLFSPILSGVAQPDAIKNGRKFECIYPRAFGAMQYGAFYDRKSGIYWSSADPLARVKMLYHTTAEDRIKVRYEWTPVQKQPFVPECSARVAVFTGHWYDAAMLYRKQIWEINARWLPEKGLPRTDTASWFRENLFWGSIQLSDPNGLHALKAVRRYLGLPFTVSLYRWNSLVWDRDYPHHKSQPSYLEYLDECRRLGVRTIPYINGRLWEEKDKREHDYLYSKIGRKNCVKNEDGSIAGSVFNQRKFSVICPYTSVYEKMMQIACNDALLPGPDGVYIDQIGAAAHILCYDPAHGHKIPDDTSWFIKGHHKVFSKIRSHFKALDPDRIFTTEDNAETCIRNFDGLETWRWTYDHQVPAFSAVYSGYSQFSGISFNRRYPEAFPAILAWQFVSGSQLGWFSISHFIQPELHEFRVWSKQLMRLRFSLLDFFNNGMMARPAEFAEKIPEKRICWGVLGTGWVTTPDIYTCSWQWDGMLAVAILNISSKKHTNKAVFDLPGRGNFKLYRFFTDGQKEVCSSAAGKVSADFSLNGRSAGLFLAVPEGKNSGRLLDKIRGQIKIISAIPGEKDPFVTDKNALVGSRNEQSGFLTVNTGVFRCLIMRGSMFPVRFLAQNYQALDKIEWNDRIQINGKNYWLSSDRYAEQKIIENTAERMVIECTGTMCSKAREEEPPLTVKAVYTFTFIRNKPFVGVSARVEVGEGKEKFSAPVLLDVRTFNQRLLFRSGAMQINGRTFSKTGKVVIK